MTQQLSTISWQNLENCRERKASVDEWLDDQLVDELLRRYSGDVVDIKSLRDDQDFDEDQAILALQRLAKAGLLREQAEQICTCGFDITGVDRCIECGTAEALSSRRISWEIVGRPRPPIVTAENCEILLLSAVDEEARAINSAFAMHTESLFGDRALPTAAVRGEHHTHLIAHCALDGRYGNPSAAAAVAAILAVAPKIRLVLVCGIAGSTARRDKSELHARLGDIVFSVNSDAVQFDSGKHYAHGIEVHFPPVGASATASRTAMALARNDLLLATYRDEVSALTTAPAVDEIDDSEDDTATAIWRPDDETLQRPKPHIVIGKIGTSNQVIKSSTIRDALSAKFDLVAVEMESAGASEAAWGANRSYFTIRAITDYSNSKKHKKWRVYASVAAARFAKFLLIQMPRHS